MTVSKPKDLSASVRQRLANYSVHSHEDFQVVLAQYGFERLLYRLSLSSYSRQFTIKGALMFLVWTGEQYRPTRDLDLTALRQHTAAELKSLFQTLCASARTLADMERAIEIGAQGQLRPSISDPDLGEREKRGSVRRFREFLAQSPDVPPEDCDKLEQP